MAKAKVLLIIFMFLIIQGSLIPFLNIGARQPDLLLILVVCLSILWGSKKGAALGLAAGLFQDILYGQALGIFALTKMLAGYLSGFTEKNIYKDFVLGPMLIVFLLTFLHEGLVFIFSEEVTRLSLMYILLNAILPKALYNFCLTPFVYLLVYFANKKNFFYPLQ